MASMYGVEIKSINKFIGHEGECVQGVVHYKGKELGFWSQDQWGGADRFDFDKCILNDAVEKYKASLPKDYALIDFVDAETLLDEVANLADNEEKFKRWTREGYSTVVKVGNEYEYIIGACNYTDEKGFNKYVKKLTGKMKNAKATIYRSLNDFIIE